MRDYDDDDDDNTKGGGKGKGGKEASVLFSSASSKRRERLARRLMTGSLVLKKNNAEEKEDLEETRTSWNALRLRRVRVPTSALFDAAPDESFEEEEGENNICLSAADEGGLVSGCAIKIDARNGVILDVWRESDDGNDDACYGGEKEKEEDELVVDCENCLLVPCFLDAHTHLIKTHTVERCRNPTGSIPDALGCELADQPRWMDVQDERTMKTDFERRFDFAVRSALYYGAIGIRTHLDGTNNLENKILRDKVFEVFSRKRNELLETRGVYLQGVCNLFLPLWSEPGIADEFAKVAAANNDNEGGDSVLLGAYCGVVGRGETNNDQARKHFRNLFSYANKYAMNIDVHIDETNDPNCCAVLSCLEAFLNDDDGNLSAFKNIRSLSLSHVCSLSLQSKATIDRVIELAKKIDEKTSTRVSFIVNPLTNLGLQDRRGTTDGVGVLIDKNIPHTPRWRGIAPIQELESAGINVCTGTDNVRDYWNPYADYDGIATLKATFEVAQLNTVPNEGYWTKLIAANAAKAMFTKLPVPKIGLIRKGYRADFILLPQARSFYELFSRPSQHERIVFRKGRPTLDAVLPDFSELDETVAVRTDAAPFLDDDVEIKRGATSLASSFSKRSREEEAEV